MCKGCAILVQEDGKGYVAANNSHDGLAAEYKVDMDAFCKLNVVYDDGEPRGYRIEIDHHDDEEVMAIYRKKGFLTQKNQPAKRILAAAKTLCRENEAKIFWCLCKYMQDANIHGDQYQIRQRVEGSQYLDSQTVKCNQYLDGQTVKGNQFLSSQTVEGSQVLNGQRVEGSQFLIDQTVEGKIYIKGIKNGGKKAQKTLDEFSQTHSSSNATLENLILWLKKK